MITVPQSPPKNIIIPRRKKHSLVDWFKMKQDDVIEQFMTLKDAEVHGQGDDRFLFVPGTRDDRVLLVSHVDTVWRDYQKEDDIEIAYHTGTFFSNKPGTGMGADDRAGICMLWKLRNLGHSLLLPCGEERHGKGSQFLMKSKEWADLINDQHQFAIEMDRMNDSDLVFYQVGSPEFTKWCEASFTGYKKTGGSYTDIVELCTKICGLNISVGYYCQHSPSEHLEQDEWNRTLSYLHKVLSGKNIPRFEQPPRPKYQGGYSGRGYCGNMYDSYMGDEHDLDPYQDAIVTAAAATVDGNIEGDPSYRDDYYRSYKSTQTDVIQKKDIGSLLDNFIMCLKCNTIQDSIEFKNNNNKCVKCNATF